MLSLSMTFHLFSTTFRSWGAVERGPTYSTSFQIPVYYHLCINSPILPLEEGYRIQAFSRYPCLVQQVMSPASSLAASKLPPRLLECLIRIAILHLVYRLRLLHPEYSQDKTIIVNVRRVPSSHLPSYQSDDVISICVVLTKTKKCVTFSPIFTFYCGLLVAIGSRSTTANPSMARS
jgi:hypothetical protein